MDINRLLNKLIEKQDLPIIEAELVMEEILSGNLTPSQIAAMLTALRMKGEMVNEILGFIKVMRRHMVKVKTSGRVIDTCGTGGDCKGTFNISTVVALVVAGAGVAVAKHGNRAASSLCGSADVLEALGVNINLSSENAGKILKKTNFTFLFAPLFHPGMKFVAQVRKDLGFRTVFNFLGPFVNPACVKRQIIGVPKIELAEKLAKVAANLNYEHLILVSSGDGLDEISLSGKTIGYEIKEKRIRKIVIDPKDYGFKYSASDRLKGGNAVFNASIIKLILSGEEGPKREVVLLNAAFALYVSGKAENLGEGKMLAQKSIDSGCAKRVLEKVIKLSEKL